MQTRITPDGYTRIDDLLRLLECNACGAVVASPGRHDEWHERLIAKLGEHDPYGWGELEREIGDDDAAAAGENWWYEHDGRLRGSIRHLLS